LEHFKDKPLPDINNFIVRQDNEELFGLKIFERAPTKINHWFDFDIKDYITLIQFLNYFDLS
jgi:hypothetical protein